MDLIWIWSDFCFPKDKLLGSIGNIAIALVNSREAVKGVKHITL